MKLTFWCLIAGLAGVGALADPAPVLELSRLGELRVDQAFTNGVTTVEKAINATGPWRPEKNQFATNGATRLSLALTNDAAFFRALTVDLAPGATGFSNLVASYSTLTTIAGRGASDSRLVEWSPSFEGAPATEAELSRPHMAMADDAGNVYIADKEAHAIRKVTPAGRIYTVAGNNTAGNAPDYPTNALSVSLDNPNGLFARGDGTVYILDTGNAKIRRLDPDGSLRTLIWDPSGVIAGGRGLWVNPDETLVYYCAAWEIRKWTPTGGVEVAASGFVELGNITVDPDGQLVATDRIGHRVYRVEAGGALTAIAGNGTASGGGSGQLALETGLYRPRGICFFPNGGFLVATDDDGSQIWYVDSAGTIWLFMNGGKSNGNHGGDGLYFRSAVGPVKYISKPRSVTFDPLGNLLIVENDVGFVRRIEFLRYTDNN